MSAKTIIGISILEEQEAQRRANLDRYGQDLEKNNQIRNQQAEINRLKNEANGVAPPSQNEIALEERVKELEELENLLSKPMKEIAQKNGAFKETYLKQQELMAQFIVSQRAFKEIAMKYGKELGKTPEQVANEARTTEETVKNGQSEFGNNVDPETKNALGYTEKRQEEINEAQKKREEEKKQLREKYNK